MSDVDSNGWTIPLDLLCRIQEVAEHSFNWRVEYPEQVEAVILAAREFSGQLGAYRISTPASAAATGGGDFPAGAIENGRALFDRVEQQYDFECEAGPLANCTDWHELRRCFEHLADWAHAQTAAPPPPAQAADGWRPAPADIYVVLRRWAERHQQDDQPLPDWLAAASREIAALQPSPPAPEAGT